MDPNPSIPNNQTGPQPGTSGQLSKRPAKYLSMEYIILYLKSTEYDFLKELANLVKTLENAYMGYHQLLIYLMPLLCSSGKSTHAFAC